jgi:hypothetical protein
MEWIQIPSLAKLTPAFPPSFGLPFTKLEPCMVHADDFQIFGLEDRRTRYFRWHPVVQMATKSVGPAACV